MTIISTTQVRKRYRSADGGCSYTTVGGGGGGGGGGDGTTIGARRRSAPVGNGRQIRDKPLCPCFVEELYVLLIRRHSSAGGVVAASHRRHTLPRNLAACVIIFL